jgi:hypothetical protein
MVESSTIPMHSPGVRSDAPPRIDPGEIRLEARKEIGDRIDEHGVGGSGVETAGLLGVSA